jgi:hypothetical protein
VTPGEYKNEVLEYQSAPTLPTKSKTPLTSFYILGGFALLTTACGWLVIDEASSRVDRLIGTLVGIPSALCSVVVPVLVEIRRIR